MVSRKANRAPNVGPAALLLLAVLVSDGLAAQGQAAQGKAVPAPEARELLARADRRYDGRGGEADWRAARELYRRAAEEDAVARLRLAILTHRGKAFVPTDRVGGAERAREILPAVRDLAASGDVAAMQAYAESLALGIGQEQDVARALDLFARAVRTDAAPAALWLGWIHAQGFGVAPDPAKARVEYGRANKAGSCAASYDLGRALLWGGSSLEKDPATGLRHLRRAAECRYPPAMVDLANVLLKGELAKADAASALGLLEQGAERGDPIAAYNLGWYAMSGIGVEQNDAGAVPWFELAAERGHSGAANYLGIFYRDGRGGLPSDRKRAGQLFVAAALAGDPWAPGNLHGLMPQLSEQDRSAILAGIEAEAKRGSAPAQATLADFLFDGTAGDRDPVRAAVLARAAADQGHAGAMGSLGFAYHKGWGVDQDHRRAVAWYRRGAQGGDPLAALRLSYKLLAGEGTARDTGEALEWLERSANAGFLPAIRYLADLLDRGSAGVPADRERALHWYRKAAAQGDVEARGRIRYLELAGQR